MSVITNSYDRIKSGSTCFIEFQKGPFRGEFWLDDSINISEETWEALNLTPLFKETVPDFDYYGISLIEAYTWAAIVAKAEEDEGWSLFVNEVSEWVNDSIKESMVVSVCGM